MSNTCISTRRPSRIVLNIMFSLYRNLWTSWLSNVVLDQHRHDRDQTFWGGTFLSLTDDYQYFVLPLQCFYLTTFEWNVEMKNCTIASLFGHDWVSQAEVEIQVDAVDPGQKVLVIDDLLATGGVSFLTRRQWNLYLASQRTVSSSARLTIATWGVWKWECSALAFLF